MTKINLIICGACGRMGSLIIELGLKDKDFLFKGGIEKPGHFMIGKEIRENIRIYENLSEIADKDDIIVDFTVPEATMEFIEVAKKRKSKILIGTTGFNKEQIEKIKETSEKIPIFLSPNMSLGVNLFLEIVKYATKLLQEYEIEIVEIHHHFKKDAPSGTAKKIAEIIGKEKVLDLEKNIKYGRFGIYNERDKNEIGIHSLRIGDIVGEHYVYFGATGEIIELNHRCYSRVSFASGALKAAKFLNKKEKGFFTMEDFIKEEVLNV